MALDLERWLLQLMDDRGADGKLIYSAEQLQDFVALVLLSGKKPPGPELPDALGRVLVVFCARAGIVGLTGEAQVKALDAYFDKHPLPPSLIERFQLEFKRTPPPNSLQVRTIRG